MRLDRMALGLFLLAAVLSGCAGRQAAEPAATLEPPSSVDWSGAQLVEVVMTDFHFAPSTIELSEGRPYRLRLVNRGSGTHDFTAPEFFRAVALEPGGGAGQVANAGTVELGRGETAELVLVPLRKGEYDLECTHLLHSTLGMTGKIKVS
jgi:uncharacterized cupredoxin-like copper-binding protein